MTPFYSDGTGACATQGTCDTQIQTYARYTCNSNNEIVQEIFWDSNCSTPCSTWTWSMNATPNYDMNSFEALAHDFASPSICDSSFQGLRCVNGDVHVAYYNDATLCEDPTSVNMSSVLSSNYSTYPRSTLILYVSFTPLYSLTTKNCSQTTCANL